MEMRRVEFLMVKYKILCFFVLNSDRYFEPEFIGVLIIEGVVGKEAAPF